MKVKTFLINGSRLKPLADQIDEKVNGFLAANPGVVLDKYEIAAELGTPLPNALVSIAYEEAKKSLEPKK